MAGLERVAAGHSDVEAMQVKPKARLDALVITGATGTGKSGLAVEVAERLSGEIISADSRQIYRGMDIGTAKPPAKLRERVPHHGFDLLDPDASYSAGRFARDAWSWIEDIRSRDKTPLIVGGSGLFLRALLQPLGPEPRVDAERRAQLRAYLSERAPALLKRWLRRLDPARAGQLEAEGGAQRLARSLEVTLLSGRPHSWWLSRPAETPPLRAVVFCLTLPREELYRRLDQRFEQMLADGLLDEVRRLLSQYSASAPGLRSVGYAELVEHLQGGLELQDAVAAAKRSTRRFARRQLTWYRHQLSSETVWLPGERPSVELLTQVLEIWRGRDAGTGRAARTPLASGD